MIKLLFNILYCSRRNNKSIFISYFCKVKIVFIEKKKMKGERRKEEKERDKFFI